MSRNWQPGEVVILSRSEGSVRAIWQGDQFATQNGSYLHDWQVTARPLVVIDPEDMQAVERLQDLYIAAESRGLSGLSMLDALREFADPKPPKPPKPDEPTGLGAVVEDDDGETWVQFVSKTGLWWRNRAGRNVRWPELDAVRVLSEGVAP